MTLETIKFGLFLTIIPFSLIFLFITVCWALMDMSLREVSGSRRVIWTLAVIALPLAGPIAYNYLVGRVNLIIVKLENQVNNLIIMINNPVQAAAKPAAKPEARA